MMSSIRAIALANAIGGGGGGTSGMIAPAYSAEET